MKIFATLPPPHREKSLQLVIDHPLVDSLRFNTGVRVSTNPKETLETLLRFCNGKDFWLDLKGRQLRISQWAVPTFGDIVLNHEIDVSLPAEIYFRNEEKSTIRKIKGNKIYVDPPPPKALGAGQAVNIPDESLKIQGYFTEEDLEYLDAAKELGIVNIMLSFVEEESDIVQLTKIIPNANIICKIESKKGIQFVKEVFPNLKNKIRLMAARDDLFIQIGENKSHIFPTLKSIIEADETAILASRLFTSLETSLEVSLSDLSDFILMKTLGYSYFLLSDGICGNEKAFLKAMEAFAKTKI
ncbi:MAG TPA: pyruvate kinase [Leptospiraceae bacterium]|nr:pyruvate kinase [Leptospiraceae bacterium]HMX33472.1 pyruvate kinase [Leptospiraceae bacterium]HMY29571.1 pyruvate kinase [Leptospiraceae bacterium]HMZ62939.1 pyruvate kinase [Leptospiraceae bacterium]HNA05990.1 pyruvate kinase [Leptospiraceae bacterium]